MQSTRPDRSSHPVVASAAFLTFMTCTVAGQPVATEQRTLQLRSGIIKGTCPNAYLDLPEKLTIGEGVDCQGLVGRVPELDNVQGIRNLIEQYANALYSGDGNTVDNLWVHDRQPVPDVKAVHNGCGIKDLDQGKFTEIVQSLTTGLANVSSEVGLNPYRAVITSIVPGVFAKVTTSARRVTSVAWEDDAFFVEGDQVVGCSRGLVARRHIFWTIVKRNNELRFADVNVQ